MARKVYGPVRGAGTQIVELEGDRPISPGALGWWGHAGLFEKGMVGELIVAQSKTAFLKKLGTYIGDGQAPDAAIDAYDLANGAGGGYYVRVTDGNEVEAEKSLYARRLLKTLVGKLKAKNGGRWGGKEYNYTNDFAVIGDLTETTLDTGLSTWTTDQLKGGWLELAEVANKRYPIIGNTAAGVITVAADSTMLTDYGAGSDKRYYVYLENESKALSYKIGDGIENPGSEWSLQIFVDGVLGPSWSNLNMDPASPRYWVSLINDDTGNDEVEAVDLWTGAYTADVRPANFWGEVATVTATVLNAVLYDFTINSPGGGDPTFALGTTTDAMLEQKITVTMSSPTAGNAVSDRFGDLGAVTLGSLFTPNNKWSPPFTVTAGASPLAATDTLVINFKPFVPDALIGGYLYPDKPNASREKYLIVDNDHKSITVSDGSDLTVSGAPGDEFMVVYAAELRGGRDGNADIADSDYVAQAWDPINSPFNRILGRNAGLVKFATPGVTATTVQKAGKDYADAKNHQYRYEVPSNVLTEDSADAYVNDTLGRSNYAVVTFPSYGYVPDPEAGTENKLKLVTLTGQIHGREAAYTRNWNGYHKAQAGQDAVLSKVQKLPTGERLLDEENLNPIGINVVKKVQGNFVVWGDRTLWLDTEWQWKHQRELMCYYENVLREAFDWITFAINDPETDRQAIVALKSFFLPEYTKRAIRGKSFEDAASIKIDAENNTDATRAAGDLNAQILLRLADTVERFIISMGKAGIFEAVA